MFQEKISLTKALELEARGEIVIIDFSPKSTTPVPHPHQESWRENYESLRRTHRTVNTNKLFSFLSPDRSDRRIRKYLYMEIFTRD